MKRNHIISFAGTFILLLIAGQQHPVPKAMMERGKMVYDKTCLSCHMDNALGVPRLAAKVVGTL